jgi:hypothetical protein
MLTYFAARKTEEVFREYRARTIAYWRAKPEDNRTWESRDLPAPENRASILRRQQVMDLFPEADASADRLGISVMAYSYSMPGVGGPVLPVNLLYAVINDNQGHEPLSQQEILDTIDRCLATAKAARKRLFWTQLLNPIWWVTGVIAYVIRIPFVILRQAGLPASVEESVWGHITKAVFFVMLLLASLRWGLKLSAKDILQFVK